MTGNIAMGSNLITGLANGSAVTDAATIGQLNTTMSQYLPLSGGTVTGNTVCTATVTLQNPIQFGITTPFGYNGSTSTQGGFSYNSFTLVPCSSSTTTLASISNGICTIGMYLVFLPIMCSGFSVTSATATLTFTSTGSTYYIPTYTMQPASFANNVNAAFMGLYMPSSQSNSLTLSIVATAGTFKSSGSLIVVRIA